MRWLFVVCAGAGWLCAQEEAGTLSPEVMLLSKIRSHAVENLRHQPNYTCVETVERSRRSATTKKLQLIDTLRLEVALVDGKEMFGWPGAKKFEDSDLTKMVNDGAIGNGDFALFARAIFSGTTATFKYRGDEPLGDRPSVRFDYRVPLMMSGYTLHIGKLESIVGYHGSVYADPQSLDMQRLEVVADDIPLALGLAEATDRMEYAHVTIADGQFLLPEASELTLTGLDGSESRNRVHFAACRQFAGESVLTFDEAPRSAAAAAETAQIELPPQMTVVLSLLDDLKARSAAVGDPVRARLQNDLKHNGRVLFAKGATATGRISRLEMHEDYIVVGIEFSEIESSEARARLNLKLEDVGGRKLFEADPLKSRPPVPRPGEGILTFRPDRSMLAHGILMFWRTTS
jgi:hypothetical protein